MYKQPWLNVAETYRGLVEKAGAANNQDILDFATVIGGPTAKDYIADSIPWCGLFVAFIMAQTGIIPVDKPLWALNWRNFGDAVKTPKLGCIAVFKRNGGGHVGFVVGQERNFYHILGGNQSDSVSITKIDKSRCVGLRWPPGMKQFMEDDAPVQQIEASISNSAKEA